MSAYGCFADVYDTLTSNIDYNELAGYYDRIITSHGGKRGILLDLACGTGSMSMQFSALGYDVIGVDLSTEMLSVAKEKPHKNTILTVKRICCVALSRYLSFAIRKDFLCLTLTL